MDSESLRTFLAIHQAGGFTRAAKRLHRSQPAVSRRIALLEHTVGAPLFERTAAGVVLSQAGRVLLPHAERALAALEDCAASIRALRTGAAGPISIAAVGTLASTDLTPLLRRFASQHRDVDLRIRTATSAEVSQLVRRGEATIGLRYQKDPSTDVVCTALPAERLVVACGAAHPLAGRRVASLRALRDESWLAFANAQVREATADSVFAQFLVRGLAAPRWTPVDSLTAQKRLIEAGFGLALLPESSIREERASGTLDTIEVGDLRAANPVYAIVRRGGYLSAAAVDLLELLKAGLALKASRGSRASRARRRPDAARRRSS